MFKTTDYADHSIAYALAAGLVTLDSTDAVDRDIERSRRAARRARLANRSK